MSDMRDRIELTIAKNTFSKAAAAILDEIAKTHVIVPRSLAERAAQNRGTGGIASFERGVIVGELATYAGEQDTP